MLWLGRKRNLQEAVEQQDVLFPQLIDGAAHVREPAAGRRPRRPPNLRETRQTRRDGKVWARIPARDRASPQALSSAGPLFTLAWHVLKFPCHFVAYKVPQNQDFVAGLGAVLQIRCTEKLLIKQKAVLQL